MDPLGLVQKFCEHVVNFDVSIAILSYVLVPVGAYLAFCQQRVNQSLGSGPKAFLCYCFALHKDSSLSFTSIKLDVGFVVIKKFVNSFILVPLLFSSLVTANLSYLVLVRHFGAQIQSSPSFSLTVFIIFVCVLTQDFVEFMVHYVHHKVKIFWSIHKVHHSSEFLMLSLSVKRTHVLEEIIGLTLTSSILGLVIGFLSYAFAIPIRDSEIYGVDTWFLLQLFSFWHLRHSHMSLSYGWLENFIQSPAQHHLHHSFEVEHWDKNFGLLFSFWDKMFGCFLRSADPRSFRIGLPERDRHEYDSVLKLYVTPFRKIFEAVVKPGRQASAATVAPPPIQSPGWRERLTAIGIVASATRPRRSQAGAYAAMAPISPPTGPVTAVNSELMDF